MIFRHAVYDDLPALKQVYRDAIAKMEAEGVHIWDDVYPAEFLYKDIDRRQLYLLEEAGEIAGVFALREGHLAGTLLPWERPRARAIYLERFVVSVSFLRRGIGKQLLSEACRVACELGYEYLRLLVVESNTPAITLYLNCGFRQVPGTYDEGILEGEVLKENGYEICLVEDKA